MESEYSTDAQRDYGKYVSALITYFDGFHSDVLTAEENKLIHEECIKIALKMCDDTNIPPETDEIVKQVLNI